MKLSIENAPFNFIHPAVNLVFGVEDRLTLERDYFGNYIQNRLIAGIYYTPIKGFTFTPNHFAITTDTKSTYDFGRV